MHVLISIPECRIGSAVEHVAKHLTIDVLLNAEGGRCPTCGQASRSVCNRHLRRPADLPAFTSRTTLSIKV